MPAAAEKIDPASILHRSPAPTQVRILADDLTGACDSAVAFANGNTAARVWLGCYATRDANERVQAFNTASRKLETDLASSIVCTAASMLHVDSDRNLLFKKIDSCARGSVAAEVLAAHRTFETTAILFAPSFPAAGRTVRNGILQVENEGMPPTSLSLPSLFPSTLHKQIVLIRDATEIFAALAGGASILLCDATTQSELESFAGLNIRNVLYAGSSGLARSLASVHASHAAPPTVPQCDAILTICGTRHPVAVQQMQHLDTESPASPRLRILADPTHATDVLAAFDRERPEALILTGGDTALFVLTTLGAHSILVRGEFAPGVPWGIIQGGRADGVVVVTKSGGFGDTATLTNIVHTLQRKSVA